MKGSSSNQTMNREDFFCLFVFYLTAETECLFSTFSFFKCLIFFIHFDREDWLFLVYLFNSRRPRVHWCFVSSEILCFRQIFVFLSNSLDSFPAVKGFSISRLDFLKNPPHMLRTAIFSWETALTELWFTSNKDRVQDGVLTRPCSFKPHLVFFVQYLKPLRNVV